MNASASRRVAVCGYRSLDFVPWVEDSASDEICVCCGTQFGYDDAARERRPGRPCRRSIGNSASGGCRDGCPLALAPRDSPPEGWSAAEQLAALEDG